MSHPLGESSVESVVKELRSLGRDVNEIKLAVTGDTKLGIEGLAKRVNQLEGWRNSINLKVAKISGMASVIAFIGLKLADWALEKLLHHQ